MKKSIVLLFFFCVSFTFIFAQTKENLIKTIQKSKEGVESIMKFSTLDFRLTSIEAKPFDETDNSHFKNGAKNLDKKKLDSLVQHFFEKLDVDRHLIYPHNFINIDNDEYDLINLLGFDSFYFSDDRRRKPQFTAKRVVFNDNSSIPIEDIVETKKSLELKYGTKKVSGSYSYYEIDTAKLGEGQKMLFDDAGSDELFFLINSPKPVKEIEFDITLPLQSKTIFTLDTVNNTFENTFGKIQLLSISGNNVALLMPSDVEDHLTIDGIYKDGRPLRFKASNKKTVFSEEKKQVLKKLIPVYEKALKLVEKDKISSEEELVQYLEQEIGDDFYVFTQGDQTLYRLEFAGPVSKVQIQQLDTAYIPHNYNVHYDLNSEDSCSFHIATDVNTWKSGILNNEGAWVVKPAYNKYFRKQNDYFYWDQIDDHSNTYLFNPEKGTIQKVDYEVNDMDVIAGKYVKIEPQVNGLKGVVDASTGEIVIPMTHRSLRNYDEKYWIGEDSRTELDGVLSLDGKTILPYRFNRVDYTNGYFYTKYNPTERIRDEVEDVYNSRGENITKGKYSEINGTFSSELLLVEVEHYDPQKANVIINTDRYFIDTLGRVALSFLGKEYHDAEPFQEGLAKVEKVNNDEYLYDGDFGYIDNTGKVVIPFMYNTSYGFHDGHAYVEYRKNGEHWYGFIDKKNKLIKKLTDGYQSGWYDQEDKKWYIRLWNDQVVDYQGNTVIRK